MENLNGALGEFHVPETKQKICYFLVGTKDSLHTERAEIEIGQNMKFSSTVT